MTLRNLLRERQTAIIGRWLEYALDAYPHHASDFLRNEKDRFANPAGHALRSSTRGVYECLLEGRDSKEICEHLDGIIKIRAVQGLSPSRAIAFVFALKRAVRHELAAELQGPDVAAGLAGVDAQIDQIALLAFDTYTRCRESVADLRINEVKRGVAALMRAFGVAGESQGSGEGVRPHVSSAREAPSAVGDKSERTPEGRENGPETKGGEL